MVTSIVPKLQPPSPEQRFRVRVYYEDTDCMGVVYHANYLRFLERARTEMITATGTSVADYAQKGMMFPLYNVNATFKSPARLCDDLEIITSAEQTSPFRLRFTQRIEHVQDRRLIIQAVTEVVCTDLKGKLREFPPLGFERLT